MTSFFKQFQATRTAATPLVAVRTSDPPSTIAGIAQCALNGKVEKTPLLVWDIIHGLRGLNTAGVAEANRLLNGANPAEVAKPAETLALIEEAAEDAIIFFHQGHRYLTDPAVIQGISNLRNVYKANGTMLVLLVVPGAILPSELARDMTVLDEPLPTVEELGEIVRALFEAYCKQDSVKQAGLKLTAADTERAVDALVGLPAFCAEQSLAISLTPQGVDFDALWERKRQAIEQTKGLSIHRGGNKFADLGGLEGIKKFGNLLIKGKQSFRLVLWVDEIEKGMAGTGTDSSGTKTDMVGHLLTWMQEKEVDAMLLYGVAGSGKSEFAKVLANECGCPCARFDIGGMEDKYIGESGGNIRTATAVADAMAQNRVLVVATCNSTSTLPPELFRRMTMGIWFFDKPTGEELAAIWKIYRAKYKIGAKDQQPNDVDWTGANIRICCQLASRLSINLMEASTYIVPVGKSAAEAIAGMRTQASNRYLSASQGGTYQQEATAAPSISGGGRRFATVDPKGGTA
jgi:hypothetical protein